jgi:glycerophosphoryl diester phosphodiesterase
VNIEIKNLPARYPHIEEQIVRAIEQADVVGDALVSSFDHETLATVRLLSDDLATAVLTSERLYLPVEYLARLDADAFHPGYRPDPDLVSALRGSNRGVNVWTVNDSTEMRDLIAAGVTGIFTDYPDRLRDVLNGRGESR